MEKSFYNDLSARLANTNLSVFCGSDIIQGGQCEKCPDIVVTKDDKVIAFIDVVTPNAFNSGKKILNHEISNSDDCIHALTDGDRVLMVTAPVIADLSIDFFVQFLRSEDSSLYHISPAGKYVLKLEQLVDKYKVGTRGLNDWSKLNESNDMFEENGVSIRFYTEELENDFFQNLLGRTVDGELCRYTSLENLFMILDTQKQNMCCVVCMNDKCELNYVDDKISIQYQSVPDDPNNCFIMSLLPIGHEDELTYWRLYGDDASGACIVYQVNQKMLRGLDSCFYLAKVSYEKDDDTHPELDFIKELVDGTFSKEGKCFTFRNWHIWKHFFKSKHFAVEDEIRLLFIPNKNYIADFRWIKNDASKIVSKMLLFSLHTNSRNAGIFPLSISRVYLGPKISDYDVINQYDYMRENTLKTIEAILPSEINEVYR